MSLHLARFRNFSLLENKGRASTSSFWRQHKDGIIAICCIIFLVVAMIVGGDPVVVRQ